MIVPNRETNLPTRTRLAFPSARAAFASFLQTVRGNGRETVLLPAYIGWSSREGSGVFDPVRASGRPYRFYPMTRALGIDVDAAMRALDAPDVGVLVLIHYFGWPDPATSVLAAEARRRGIYVLEDEAHALLTDVTGGVAGRDGHAAIYSLHKMLPVLEGGMLVWNGDVLGDNSEAPQAATSIDDRYDLGRMARRRIENAQKLQELLAPLEGRVDPLWDTLPPGVVPQTYPVIIRTVDRSKLYHEMNAAGYGVVSLYHTMITEIPATDFPDAHWLAARVMNLPVHPGVDEHGLRGLVAELGRLTDV